MNRYIFIHRLTGPAILMLLGLVALLSQAHIARFSIFVPLLLILLGVLKLAERAALAQDPNVNPYGNPYGSGGPQNPYASGAQSTGIISTAIVPTHQNGSDTDEGKQ